jgi:hypothetical protein
LSGLTAQHYVAEDSIDSNGRDQMSVMLVEERKNMVDVLGDALEGQTCRKLFDDLLAALGNNGERQSQRARRAHRNSVNGNAPHFVVKSDDLTVNSFGYAESEKRTRECLVDSGNRFVVTLEQIGDDLDLANVTVMILGAMNCGCEGCVKHALNLATIQHAVVRN